MNWIDIIIAILSTFILCFSLFLISGYIFIGLFSIGELRKYLNKNRKEAVH